MAAYNPLTGKYVGANSVYSPILMPRYIQEFETTSNGLSYGTMEQAYILGYFPDLLLAESSDGEIGYIRTSDLHSHYASNPAEGCTQGMNPFVENIPVYDLGGNIIGSFAACYNVTDI